jgi:hypothetical protein
MEYSEILKRKIELYGNTQMAIESAIEEYATRRVIEELNWALTKQMFNGYHYERTTAAIKTRIEEFELMIKPAKFDYEYEMLIDYDGGPFEKGQWVPCATDSIRNPENIDQYIENGLLRKVKS